MALASLTVDLVANLGKFEGDFGKAAQIVARNSEKMTGAQRAFLKQLERTGERAGKTEAEFLAIKAATLGMSDAYERYVGNLSAGQSAVTAAASGVSETYRASGAAAQAAGDKQVSVNAQLADSIRQVRAAYDQQREAAIAANKAGALSDDGLKARLGGLGSQFNDSVAQLKAQAQVDAALQRTKEIEEQATAARRAALVKLTEQIGGVNAKYREQIALLQESLSKGDITPKQFTVRVAQVNAQRPEVKRFQEEAAAQQAAARATAEVEVEAAARRRLAIGSVADALKDVEAGYRQNVGAIKSALDAGAISPSKYAEQANAARAAADAEIQAIQSVAQAREASGQKYLQQLREQVAAIGQSREAQQFQRAKDLGVEQEAAPIIARQGKQEFLVSIENQIAEVRRLTAELGKTKTEVRELQAARLNIFGEAGESIRELERVEKSFDQVAASIKRANAAKAQDDAFLAGISAQIEAQQRLALEFGKTETEVLSLRAAQRGLTEQSAEGIAQLERLIAANKQVAESARLAAAAKAEDDAFVAKINAQIDAERRLAAEFGKTEIEVLQLQAAQRGLGESLAPALAQLKALKEANAARAPETERSTPAQEFIAGLVREREEAGKTREQLQLLKAARLGLSQEVAQPVVTATFDRELTAQIEAQIAAQRRLRSEFGKSAAEVLELRAAERGLTEQTKTGIAELKRLTTANEELSAARAKAAATESANNSFIANLEREAAVIGKTRSEIFALDAAQRGLADKAAPLIARIAEAEKNINKFGISAAGAAAKAKISAYELQTLSYTASDVVASLASGISPLTILLQQGGQVRDVFGSFGAVFTKVAGLFTVFRVAAASVVGVVGSIAYAMYQGAQQSREYADAIVLSGNFAGKTEGQFNALAKSIAASGEVTVSAAREVAQALIATGEVGPAVFDQAASAAARYAQATGKTAKEVAQDFGSMGRDVFAWAAEHNRSLNFLTYAQLQQIKSLQEVGRAADAQGVVYQALNQRLAALEPNLGTLDRALRATKNGWAAFWDAAFDVGRNQTIEDKLESAAKRVEELRRRAATPQQLSRFAAPQALRQDSAANQDATQRLLRPAVAELNALEQAKQFKDAAAAAEASAAAQTKAGLAATELIERYAKAGKSTELYAKALNELNRAFEARAKVGDPVSDEQREAALKALKDQFTDKGAAGKVESEAERARKAQLEQDLKALQEGLAAQRATENFHNQELQAIYQSGTLSLRAYYDDKNKTLADGIAAELEILKKERARLAEYRDLPTTAGSDRIKTQTRIDESQAKSDAVALEGARLLRLANLEQEASFKQLGDRVAEYRAQLLQLAGDERAAAEIRAQRAIAEAKTLSVQATSLKTPGDFARFDRGQTAVDTQGLERVLQLTNDFAEAQRQLGLVTSAAAREEDLFLLNAEKRGLSLREIEDGVYAVRQDQLEQLGALRDKALALAEASTDPRIKAFASDLAVQYARAASEVDPALKRLEAAGKDAATSIADSIGQAIVKFTSFKDLISSIEQDLLRIGTKLLITDPLTKSLEGVLKGFSSGDSGFASALRSIVGVGGSPLRIDASVAGIVSQPSVARDALRQIEGGASAVAAGADAAGQAALTAATAAQTGALAALTAASTTATAASTAETAASATATAALGALAAAAGAAAAALGATAGSSGIAGAANFIGPLLPSAKGHAFTGVARFARGDRFAEDGIFPFAGKNSGAHARFAGGGAFTNQVISAPTMFRFKEGGQFKLGEMGEAGPEAVMPLRGPSGGDGVQSFKADGTAGPVMKLARGAGGVLGVRAFAQGGTFAPAAPVRRHAAGGMFAAPRASVVAPAARSAVIAARAVSAVSSTPAAVKQMPAVEQHFHFSTQPDRRTMRQVGAEAYRGAAESWRANG